MRLTGLIRLGRDAEIRYTDDGKPVASLSAAWNYGRKGEDGRRPTQWADLSLWGEKAEGLADWLTKGRQLFVIARDVHIKTYDRRDGGTGSKLVVTIETIEFAGSNEQQGQQSSASQPAPRAAAPAPRTHGDRHGGPNNRPKAGSAGSFDDMDEDSIPI